MGSGPEKGLSEPAEARATHTTTGQLCSGRGWETAPESSRWRGGWGELAWDSGAGTTEGRRFQSTVEPKARPLGRFLHREQPDVVSKAGRAPFWESLMAPSTTGRARCGG